MINLLRSLTNRNQIASRLKASETIINAFVENPPMDMAVNWNGKVTMDMLGASYEAVSLHTDVFYSRLCYNYSM